MIRTSASFLVLTLAVSLQGCIYITEAEWEAFNDRDQDGLDFGVDCDDSNDQVQGTVKFYPDADGDGFGDAEGQAVDACATAPPDGYVQNNTDCNDAAGNAFPGGVEVCDAVNLDEDCNGAADDADNDAEGKVLWYADDDGDLFGDVNDGGVLACDPPTGTEVTDNTDCDDGARDVNPDGTEVCDPGSLVDEDCNGQIDDDDPGLDTSSAIQWYDDFDLDGYGNLDVPEGALSCAPPDVTSADNGDDCNDADGAINPGAAEVCDPMDVDENCDIAADDNDLNVDLATASVWYIDEDGDGFGDLNDAGVLRCDPVGNEVADNTDCDDALDYVNPDGTEVCDAKSAIDEDCDGLIDGQQLSPQDLPQWWPDLDMDGFGDQNATPFGSCNAAGFVQNDLDCDDGDPDANPDASERYSDGVDSNCDGQDWLCGSGTVARVYPSVGVSGGDHDFATIQEAIDAFDQVNWCDGDVIEVMAGTYNENLVVSIVSPTIRSFGGSALTTIQGDGLSRTVQLSNSSGSFCGFKVTGGDAGGSDGGGVQVWYGTDVELCDLEVYGNNASEGGGIDITNPIDVTLRDVVVRDNTATSAAQGEGGGGINVNARIGSITNGVLHLENLEVYGNSSNGIGGGINLGYNDASSSSPSVVLSNAWVYDNTAFTGAGLEAREVLNLTVMDSDFDTNTATNNAGGIRLADSTATLVNVGLAGNTGSTVAAMASINQAGTLSVEDVVVDGSVLTNVGGTGEAVSIKGGAFPFGAVIRGMEVAGTLRNSGNPASGADLLVEGDVDASNVLVHHHSGVAGMEIREATSGAAADHVITNSAFVDGAHDGLYISAATANRIELVNNVFAFNDEWGVSNLLLSPQLTAYNCVFDNALGDYEWNGGLTGTGGNISADPLYTNAALDDYTIPVGSPLIDAGDPAILDTDGTVSDIGHTGGPDGE